MPPHNPKKYLYDIIDCCEFLLDFTKGKTVQDYKNDRAFRSAVKRELQIIGEAITRLDSVSPEIANKIPITAISSVFAISSFTATTASTRIQYGMLSKSNSKACLIRLGNSYNLIKR